MKQYLELVDKILTNGVKKQDRTGTGTLSIFGHQMRFDLSEGFPLLTTKKLHTRSIFEELFWFLAGDTSNRSLNKLNVNIWNEWADNNGDLGKIYSAQWRYSLSSSNKPIKIKVDNCYIHHKVVVDTEFKVDNVTSNQHIYKLWYNIINSCHNTNHSGYLISNNRVRVSSDWHNYDNFLNDISKVKGYAHWIKEPRKYVLCPRYLGYYTYGKDTSIFVPKHIASMLKQNEYTVYEFDSKLYDNAVDVFYAVKDKYGININMKHINTIAEYNDLSKIARSLLSEDERKLVGHIKNVTAGKDYIYRPLVWIDQIEELINQIKTNKDSRRLIVSAWNVDEIEDMALPPCHTMFQFYVDDKNRLSCQLYQRSGDVFLGVPFNIASYSLLTCMIAQVCGLEVGEFVHTIGDAHIYLNHIEQCKLQLSREVKELPKLILNKDVTSIYDFTIGDVSIVGYNPHPHIKGEVSV